MEAVPFTRQEQSLIEESILRTTNINVRSILKRTRHAGVLKQMCYLIGCEVINLKHIFDEVEELNLSFGILRLSSDADTTRADLTMNRSVMTNHYSMFEASRYNGNGTQPMLKYLNQLLTVRRKIEISVTRVLQKKIDSFLYSSCKFLRYSKDNMTRDRVLSRLKQIELMTLEDAKAAMLASSEEEKHLSDLGDIHVDRGMVKHNAVQTHFDLDSLEADFNQGNKDMMFIIKRKCSTRSTKLIETLHQAAAQEHHDDKYLSAQLMINGKTVLPYLEQVNVIEHHPNNDRLVKLIYA
uniref:Uncharacterized protein n=1 Tax=Cacopsylla melanoneura TaxID=428564 RepID=A0A8D8SU87_9HEMI